MLSREGQSEFTFFPLSWFGFIILFYVMKIFWISKSVLHSSCTSSKYTHKETGTPGTGFRNPSHASQSGEHEKLTHSRHTSTKSLATKDAGGALESK